MVFLLYLPDQKTVYHKFGINMHSNDKRSTFFPSGHCTDHHYFIVFPIYYVKLQNRVGWFAVRKWVVSPVCELALGMQSPLCLVNQTVPAKLHQQYFFFNCLEIFGTKTHFFFSQKNIVIRGTSRYSPKCFPLKGFFFNITFAKRSKLLCSSVPQST